MKNQTLSLARRSQLFALVAVLSASALGYEIALMRMLLIASWHHFAFVVISVALLGFAASGTALGLARAWWLRHATRALPILAVATAIAMPTCWALAQYIPIDVRFVPALLWRQVGWWIAYWALLTAPFTIGAMAIGLSLMIAGRRVGAVYAANLIGSAVGALGITAVMGALSPAWLAALCGGVGMLSVLFAPSWGYLQRLGLLLAGLLGIALLILVDAPTIRIDPYKARATVAQLERQGLARRAAVANSPRGHLEVFLGDQFHDLPFLSVEAAPPPLSAILIDGHPAGSLLRVSSADEAGAVDQLLAAAGYMLAPPKSRVLLLGEIGGANIWLARRSGASGVRVVQPHKALGDVMRGPMRDHGGSVFQQPTVTLTVADPRHFVSHAGQQYDLIQIASLEGSAVGSAGMGGLGQDHLTTVAGIGACIDRLTDDGLLLTCRGIQTPPRDNIKLLATFAEALRARGVRDPGDHIVIVRDFLGVCMMVRRTPWPDDTPQRVRALCRERQLTPVWFNGVNPEEMNRPDALMSAPEGPGDWYHYAATQLSADDVTRRSFVDRYSFDIRPPTDDRPFFADFARWRTFAAMRQAFGDLWLTRAELAFLFVLGSLVVIGVFGLLVTIGPLLIAGRIGRWRGVAPVTLYFTAIGLGYLVLEVTMLSDIIHLIGDPVLAAAVTIAAFLFSSGVGSLVAARLNAQAVRPIVLILLGVACVGLAEQTGAQIVIEALAGVPPGGRIVMALVMIAPLGFLMGFAMAAGLARLDAGAPALVPWAWGVNGLASVLAAPLATALGMSYGFTIAGVAAAGLYVIAAMVFVRLPVGSD